MLRNVSIGFIVSGSSVLGGAETLIIRMLNWLRTNNYKTFAVIRKNDVFETSFFDRLSSEVDLIHYIDCDSILPTFKSLNIEFETANRIIVISMQNQFNYFLSEMIKIKYKKHNIQNYHYMIHENDFCRDKFINNKLIKSLFNKVYKNIVQEMIDNNKFVFMDERYLSSIEENYNLDIINPSIIRLGMSILPFDKTMIKKRYDSYPITFTTISRLEFPTKGYVLGLIDSFSSIVEKYPNKKLKLRIIGDGPNKNEMIKKIDSKNFDTQNSIETINTIHYDSIPGYLTDTRLFIGIATTLLDASNLSCLPITGLINSKESKTSGFFFENIVDLGYKGDKSMTEYMDQVINLDFNNYLKFCEHNYLEFKNTYDININMDKWINLAQSQNEILNKFQLNLIIYFRYIVDKLNKGARK
ncbi:MAG: hypothetical protein WBO70_05330 [Erysipelotrichaceae bacterium]